MTDSGKGNGHINASHIKNNVKTSFVCKVVRFKGFVGRNLIYNQDETRDKKQVVPQESVEFV